MRIVQTTTNMLMIRSSIAKASQECAPFISACLLLHHLLWNFLMPLREVACLLASPFAATLENGTGSFSSRFINFQ